MDTAEMATGDNDTLAIFLTLAWFREGGLDENTSPRDAWVSPALAYISSLHDASPNAEVTVRTLVSRNNLQRDCYMAKKPVAARTSV